LLVHAAVAPDLTDETRVARGNLFDRICSEWNKEAALTETAVALTTPARWQWVFDELAQRDRELLEAEREMKMSAVDCGVHIVALARRVVPVFLRSIVLNALVSTLLE
jgi:hypothetical protein